MDVYIIPVLYIATFVDKMGKTYCTPVAYTASKLFALSPNFQIRKLLY